MIACSSLKQIKFPLGREVRERKDHVFPTLSQSEFPVHWCTDYAKRRFFCRQDFRNRLFPIPLPASLLGRPTFAFAATQDAVAAVVALAVAVAAAGAVVVAGAVTVAAAAVIAVVAVQVAVVDVLVAVAAAVEIVAGGAVFGSGSADTALQW